MTGKKEKQQQKFDRGYYRRYYHDPRTAVNTRGEMRDLARFIAAYLRYIDMPVRRILDAGCGCGWLRAPFKRFLPSARYVGLEVSEYLCKRHGWTRGSIDSYRASTLFDLIVCNGVLQYLDDRAAARAIANLARLSSGALYFSALTAADWRANCDRRCTDGDVRLRAVQWYRTRLRRGFREIGGGLWVRRGTGPTLWELESVPRPEGG